MTDLRLKLDQARADYEAARYPGTLADEVLPPIARRPTASLRYWAAAAVLLAMASVIWTANRSPLPNPSTLGLGDPPSQQQIVRPTVATLDGRMPITFPGAPFVAATPPVMVSLSTFPQTWEAIRDPQQIGPKLWQNLERHGFVVPPMPFGADAPRPEAAPTSQRAV